MVLRTNYKTLPSRDSNIRIAMAKFGSVKAASCSGTRHAFWCCGWRSCLSRCGQLAGGHLYQPQVLTLMLHPT